MAKTTLGILLITTLMLLQAGCKKDGDNKDPFQPLVFISSADHRYGEVYYAEGDGSNAKRISEKGDGSLFDAEYYPTVSPDGNHVLFRGSDFKLKCYNLNSNSLTILESAWEFCWINDGPKVAYITNNLEKQIVTCNPDGSELRMITSYHDKYPHLGDTMINFSGLQWHEGRKQILSGGNFTSDNLNGRHLVFINPATGIIEEYYPLSVGTDFHLQGNKITWSVEDTVFIHNLLTKETTHFVHEGNGEIRHPVISPDGNRIAYIRRDGVTDIYTCNLSGFDKRNVTEQIPVKEKYGSLFYPFWVDANSLLYSALSIYQITDNITPTKKELAKGLQAGGQVQMIR